MKKQIFLITLILLLFSSYEKYIKKDINVLYDSDTNSFIYNNKLYEIKQPEEKLTWKEFCFNLFMAIFLTCFAGAMSGLTVGYLSIDSLILELKISNGTDDEKFYAKKILKIISNHHWLLVTLLLCNSFAAEYMPIVLDKLCGEFAAVIISVTLLLFFGEIIPQALCTGPNQMKIASILSPFTYFLMVITYPISYPIALLMDFVIGIHGKNRFCNSDLRSLIELHTYDAMKQIDEDNNDEEEEDNLKTKNNNDNENDNEIKIEEGKEYKKIPENLDNKNIYGLSNEQAKYMVGVLDMTTKKVLDIMIPITEIVMIDFDKPMTKEYLDFMLTKGFSRFPIYKENKDNIIGILRMKKLIGVNLFENKSLNELKINLSPPLIIDKNFGVLNLLTEFTKGRSHMAFITEKEDVENLQKKFGLDRNNSLKDNSYFNIINSNINVNTKILGIVTLEDVIEKMFNVNILDEDDYNKIKYNKKKIKKMLTKQIAQSFIEKKKDKINEIITNSLTNNVLINEENPYKKIGETEEENKDFWV